MLKINEKLIPTNWKKLWENPSPTSSFSSQTVALSESLNNYKNYIVIYLLASDNNFVTITKNTMVGYGHRATTVAALMNNFRDVTSASRTSMTFSDCTQISSSGAQSTANQRLIPLYVYGEKF